MAHFVAGSYNRGYVRYYIHLNSNQHPFDHGWRGSSLPHRATRLDRVFGFAAPAEEEALFQAALPALTSPCVLRCFLHDAPSECFRLSSNFQKSELALLRPQRAND